MKLIELLNHNILTDTSLITITGEDFVAHCSTWEVIPEGHTSRLDVKMDDYVIERDFGDFEDELRFYTNQNCIQYDGEDGVFIEATDGERYQLTFSHNNVTIDPNRYKS